MPGILQYQLTPVYYPRHIVQFGHSNNALNNNVGIFKQQILQPNTFHQYTECTSRSCLTMMTVAVRVSSGNRQARQRQALLRQHLNCVVHWLYKSSTCHNYPPCSAELPPSMAQHVLPPLLTAETHWTQYRLRSFMEWSCHIAELVIAPEAICSTCSMSCLACDTAATSMWLVMSALTTRHDQPTTFGVCSRHCQVMFRQHGAENTPNEWLQFCWVCAAMAEPASQLSNPTTTHRGTLAIHLHGMTVC